MSRSAAAPSTLLLTPRDRAILAMVYLYDGLVTDQIRRRFWPSFGARSACYDRIARLIADGYLRTHRLPSLTGRGSGKAFLTIGTRGRRELVEYLEDPTLRRRVSDPAVTPQFVAHHIATSDVRLSIELAIEQRTDVTLLDWTSERELRKTPIRVRDPLTLSTVPIVPDGAFILNVTDHQAQCFLLEQDMGTVAPKRMRTKLRAYLTLTSSELVPVLFVVPNAIRHQSITQWTTQEAANLAADPTLIWITTFAAVNEASVLSEPIWQVVGVSDPQRLVPHNGQVAPQISARVFRGQLLFGGGGDR